MSTTDTVSFPGGRKTGFPASSQVTFSSLPTSMSCAGAWRGASASTTTSRSVSVKRMSSSNGSVGYVAPRHPQRSRSAMLRAPGARVNPDRIPEGDGPPRALRRRERALAVRVVIDRVSKTYVDRRGQAVDALGEVSLAVESEEFVALLGPSGCAAVLYSHKFALDRARAVAFMKGYVKSSRHYFDAVLRKRSGPEFDEVVAITAKHTGARADLIRRGFPYQDRDGRLMPGDIDVRVIRACRELGIAPVAVFSEADREALHVLMADEAYPIGPAPATESYLNIERLVNVAKAAGADAVHPGYGFLAENAAFAEACGAAGLVFVGPPPTAIRAMGDKIAARRIARELGVLMVPGTLEPVTDDAAARATASEIGYPLMIKAAMGGGGKGMRLVRQAAELEGALRAARGESAGAFGDSAVYLERYVEEARHIEIQVLADAHGRVIHLGERECSIQRRHQKLVEECPSPFVDAAMRERMGQAACRIAKAAGYVSAGTVEFLVDAERNFYFLEMNTRLQVEHPVTELVTGIDLVREQLRIAAGEPLRPVHDDVQLRGAALECRINAEDPFGGWLPSPGTITALRGASGPWVREDSGVYEGYTVPRFYDTLLAKLIVWGVDRDGDRADGARARSID